MPAIRRHYDHSRSIIEIQQQHRSLTARLPPHRPKPKRRRPLKPPTHQREDRLLKFSQSLDQSRSHGRSLGPVHIWLHMSLHRWLHIWRICAGRDAYGIAHGGPLRLRHLALARDRWLPPNRPGLRAGACCLPGRRLPSMLVVHIWSRATSRCSAGVAQAGPRSGAGTGKFPKRDFFNGLREGGRGIGVVRRFPDGDRSGMRGGDFCFGFELEGGLSKWVVRVVSGVVVDPVAG